jgi:restriction system protein
MNGQRTGVRTQRFSSRAGLACKACAAAFLMLAFAVPALAASPPQLRAAWSTLRTALPWTAGALAVLGPLVYMALGRRRHRLRVSFSIESVRRLSPREFERVLSESFRLRGYAVEQRESRELAAGVCLVLRKAGQRVLVSCVHRIGAQVGVEAARGLHEVMSLEGATGGLIVTTEQLSSEARAWVADKPIGLIEERALLELVNRGRARKPRSANVPSRREPYLGPPLAELLDCPLCGAPMVFKQDQRLSQAGAAFFGCSVPHCPGTRPA